jgi:hypothetical protein
MVNSAFNLGPAPFDFRLKGGDAGLEFVDRQMIDILPDELVHRVVGALGEKIVGLHAHNVDPDGPHVNKPIENRFGA